MLSRLLTCLTLAAIPAIGSAQCGGALPTFLSGLKSEAIARGLPANVADGFLSGARIDPAVIRADRAQGVFQLPFIDFARRLISADRLRRGAQMAVRHDAIFDRIERDYGIPRGVLLAFWAFETDYGSFQGDFNTRDALITLSHDCRRPELFRPQIFAAMQLYANGDFDPGRTTGAWAGEIGMVQMLPADILEHGLDGDGDGHVRLKTSPEDALLSGARMLSHLGWHPEQPWLQEVRLPAGFDWAQTGLATTRPVAEWQRMGVRARTGTLPSGGMNASILIPQGHKGPAFIAYPNFRVYFEWNQSFTYVMTAAYFATRLQGAPVFDAGQPDPGLDGAAMKRLQQKLAQRGHDVGEIDGILGAGTRAAVRAEQSRLGFPVDGWPTPTLLNAL